jgi:hypothetical protein
MYCLTVGTWDRLTLHAKYPSCQPNRTPGWSFIHREEFAFNTCMVFAMPRVGPIAHSFGCRSSGITFRRFFVLNTMWTWLLTYELGIVSSLRDSFT